MNKINIRNNPNILTFLVFLSVLLAAPSMVSAYGERESGNGYESTFQYVIDQAKKLYEDSLNNNRAGSTISADLKSLHEKIVLLSVQSELGSYGEANTAGRAASSGSDVMTDIRGIRSALVSRNDGNYCQIESANDFLSLKEGISCLQKILRGEEGPVSLSRSSYLYNQNSFTMPSCIIGCLDPSVYNPVRPSLQDISQILGSVQSRAKQLSLIPPNRNVVNNNNQTNETNHTVKTNDCSVLGTCDSSIVKTPSPHTMPMQQGDDLVAIRSLLKQVLERIEQLLSSRN